MHIFFRFWLPVLVYMGIIFFLSSQPITIDAPKGFHIDKGAHIIVYGGLGFLFLRAWLQGVYFRATLYTFLITVIFTMVYGISDEFHQSFVPSRSPDLWDVVADTAGAVLVSAGVYLYLMVKTRVAEVS